jgi:hypothetical protein
MDEITKNFLTYDYPKAKDLAKSFLTLIAAILVVSITFSEKIIGFQTATRSKKVFLVMSWVLFFIAIICCGVALVFHYMAVLEAIDCGLLPCDSPRYSLNYRDFFNIGSTIMGFAGISFGLGLISLIGSALLSMSMSSLRRPSIEGSSTDVLIERLVLDSDSDPKLETAPGERSTPL